MGIGDGMIEKAVEEAFDKSGLEPGELNDKIDSVMEVTKETSERLDEARGFQKNIKSDIRELREAAELLAEASITISEKGADAEQSLDEHGERIDSLEDSIDDLNESFSKVSEFIEENSD